MTTPPLVACVLLAAVAVVTVAPPPAGAVCVPRNGKAPGKPGMSPAPPKKPTPAPPPPPSKTKPILPGPGGDLVKALCAKTDYPVVCQMMVVPPPGVAAAKLDATAVLRLAMGAVRAKAAAAKKAAGALAADAKTPALAKPALRDCVDSYDDIAYSLDEADKAMATGDKDTTGTMLDTARTDVDTCDQGFEEREGDIPPLMSKQDAELAKLASNCIAIAVAAGLRSS
uniref:Pectinesterase inhibitor domain-containing protein n=1 Tax=Oryza punctata TaxID=4537 RepID=A0A0E0MNJ9_ORYPU